MRRGPDVFASIGDHRTWYPIALQTIYNYIARGRMRRQRLPRHIREHAHPRLGRTLDFAQPRRNGALPRHEPWRRTIRGNLVRFEQIALVFG